MIIYVWAENWVTRGTKEFSTTHSTETLKHTIGFTLWKENGLEHMVKTIIARAKDQKSIWLLRLCSRGNAGVMYLGRPPGLTEETAVELRPLAEYFCPDARGIELHADHVASGESNKAVKKEGGIGERMMQRVADVTGVTVVADTGVEYAQLVGDRKYEFEGREVWVYPRKPVKR